MLPKRVYVVPAISRSEVKHQGDIFRLAKYFDDELMNEIID